MLLLFTWNASRMRKNSLPFITRLHAPTFFVSASLTVKDETHLRALIRYNNFLVDTLGISGQKCVGGASSGSNSIAVRRDLTDP